MVLLDVQGFKMVTKKTMGSTEHKETLKTWLLMSDEFSGTGFANSLADYENVLRVCCRNEWGVPASVGVIQDAASGGVPSALSKCATILLATLSIVVLAGCRYEAVDANADVVDYIIRGDARGASKEHYGVRPHGHTSVRRKAAAGWRSCRIRSCENFVSDFAAGGE